MTPTAADSSLRAADVAAAGALYLAGLATGRRSTRSRTGVRAFTAAADVLDKNSIALGKSMRACTAQRQARSSSPCGARTSVSFVDYTLGAGKEQAKKDKAVKDLDGYRADSALSSRRPNPNLPKDAVADELSRTWQASRSGRSAGSW